MKGISALLNKKYGELVFGLFGGVGYLGIILSFIMQNTANGGLLLTWFFFPFIICLPAILLIKLSRSLREKERFTALNILMWLHVLLFAVSLVLIFDVAVG